MEYSLSHSYFGDAFVNGFDWFNGNDPSNGFVRYQSEPDARVQGLYSIDSSTQTVILGVDSTNVFPLNGGRPSVRLESKRAYNHGLFIGDFSHMPPSTCGLWPAFWMYGPNWPNSGEIDIIEGANTATRNLLSAHTSEGCSIPRLPNSSTRGEAITFDCTSPGNNNNAGCSYLPDPLDRFTYGDPFNAVGGGVYAMDWTAEEIRIWHWSRQYIPRDIINKRPDPESWGPPSALFGTSSCDPDRYFRDMSIIIQTNFCGDYAGSTWGVLDSCDRLAPTCQDFVANNPRAFENAYWEINYIDVYEWGQKRKSESESEPAPEPAPEPGLDAAEPTTTTTISTTSTITHTIDPFASGNVEISHSLPVQSTPVPEVVAGPPSENQDPIVPHRDPATIGEFVFLGCMGSESGFSTFERAQAAENMTPELCVKRCNSRRYAGVHQDQCLCADDLDGFTRALSDRSECDKPCPGNAVEYCGGVASTAPFGSEEESPQSGISARVLISLYGIVGGADESPLPAPPLGDDSGESQVVQGHAHEEEEEEAHSSHRHGHIHHHGHRPSHGKESAGHHHHHHGVPDEEDGRNFAHHREEFRVHTATIPYVTICPTDRARLITTEYCTTYTRHVTPCQCSAGWKEEEWEGPRFRTAVESCDACGPRGGSVVTLTVPEGVPDERPRPPAPTPDERPDRPVNHPDRPVGDDLPDPVPAPTPDAPSLADADEDEDERPPPGLGSPSLEDPETTGLVLVDDAAALTPAFAVLVPLAATFLALLL